MKNDSEPIRLTQTVQKGGCAAKVAASELRQILNKVKFPQKHASLMVDGSHFDDAAIYKVTNEIALVQTIDFFTPIVDSPYYFGKIAACNALSDVYAMGGIPKTAMAVLAFPLAQMDSAIISEVLQGASDLLMKADCNFVGGHSIDDDSLKFGLSVTGFVHPERVWANTKAQAGDTLVLTKALGTGTTTAALKRSALKESEIMEVLESMMTLNNAPQLLPSNLLPHIHAATDITGFGLSGHSYQLAKASQVKLEIDASSLPIFMRSQHCLENEFLTKAHRTNREYTAEHLNCVDLAKWQELLVHDPQTSGGLLLSVAPQFAHEILKLLIPHFPSARIIGKVLEKSNLSTEFVRILNSSVL